LRAAVVGTGFGARVHVPALRAAGFDVVALVGRDAARTERRAARLGVEAAAVALDDVLDRVDAVTIATPPDTHAPLVLACVAAGRHALCEKPFALNAGEAVEMVEAARAAGVVGLVGHEFRYDVARATLARAVRSGSVGEARFATFVAHVPLVAPLDAPVPSWWFSVARGGGWLGASGSHLVDQLRVCLGEVDAVAAALSMVSARAPAMAEDSFTVTARMRSGAVAMLQQTAAARGPLVSVTRVAGTDGSAWIDGDDVWLARDDGVERVEVAPADVLPAGPPRFDHPAGRYTHLELGPYTRLAERFRDAIVRGAVPADVPTFADGLAGMRVLDAVRESSASRQWVPVHHSEP
jgi:predicted dehydrogenase